ncbi:tetratricopeptide repeat protein [Micromonospora sp. NBC_01392]|uniref:tetratricopeptide repeat protein n=1 Tax=Micromonospora sp. NBC_01392 TaxID=2903588 RepID=UPI00324A6191
MTEVDQPAADVRLGSGQGVQVGSGNVQHNHFHHRSSAVDWPVQVGVVPAEADCYQARRLVHGREGASGTLVLSGLGGVGKTQVAAKVANAAWAAQEVDLLLWATASTRDAVVAAYVRAAAAVGVARADEGERAAVALLAWLQRTDRRWLVVLDDVANPGDLRGWWPPISPAGRVLLTTRRRDAAMTSHSRETAMVELFTPTEATRYLQCKLGPLAADAEAAARLAEDVGHLPLALAQAAAFMIDRGLDCAAYRRRFADRKHRLLDLTPESDLLPDDQSMTIATTWSMSVELANQLRPVGLAGLVLDLLSVLDPNGVPATVLTSGPVLDSLSGARSSAVDADMVRDALHALDRLSLITYRSPRPVRVHALVQRATREQLGERLDETVRVAADALYQAWPRNERDHDLVALLRANAASVTAHGVTHRRQVLLDDSTGGHPLLLRVGTSLGRAGRVDAAVRYFRHLHATAAAQLGTDHPFLSRTSYEIAYWRGESGEFAEAARTFEELAREREGRLGADHPETLAARFQHALWRGEAGDASGALAAFERLLPVYRRVFGPEHVDTLRLRSRLAYVRGESGDAPGAVAAFRDLLADRLRLLGPDDRDTLAARHLAARWQAIAGDPWGAAEATRELVVDGIRVLGPDHPDTFHFRHSLARWRGFSGDVAGALADFAQLLGDRTRVLGPDHPYTLATRYQIARWTGAAGDRAGAADLFRRLVTDRERVLGPDHPDTRNARHNLAYWRGEIDELPAETRRRSDH